MSSIASDWIRKNPWSYGGSPTSGEPNMWLDQSKPRMTRATGEDLFEKTVRSQLDPSISGKLVKAYKAKCAIERSLDVAYRNLTAACIETDRESNDLVVASGMRDPTVSWQKYLRRARAEESIRFHISDGLFPSYHGHIDQLRYYDGFILTDELVGHDASHMLSVESAYRHEKIVRKFIKKLEKQIDIRMKLSNWILGEKNEILTYEREMRARSHQMEVGRLFSLMYEVRDWLRCRGLDVNG